MGDPFRGFEISRKLPELNIVPVLDMLIAIIFFILLSVSLVGYTKLVVPPASTKTVLADPNTSIPNNPKLFLKKLDATSKKVIAFLKWDGVQPGTREVIIELDVDENPKTIIKLMQPMLLEYKTKHPTDKTLQIGLESKLEYQWLITAMDAAREVLPDIVLLSYHSLEVKKEN